VPDFEISGSPWLAVNAHRHISRVCHTQTIHEDAAEAADGPNNTRPADPAVGTLTRAAACSIAVLIVYNTRAPDPLVLRVLALRGSRRDQKQREGEEPARSSSGDAGGYVLHI
jgi:hypothetical protein